VKYEVKLDSGEIVPNTIESFSDVTRRRLPGGEISIFLLVLAYFYFCELKISTYVWRRSSQKIKYYFKVPTYQHIISNKLLTYILNKNFIVILHLNHLIY
jgi:hypothetical protein